MRRVERSALLAQSNQRTQPIGLGRDGNSFAAVSLLAWALLLPAPAAAQMRVLSGSYLGDGSAGRPIFVGYQPDLVIVDMDDTVTVAPDEAVIRTSTMVGAFSKDMDRPNPPAADKIQSLSATGFTVGTHATVNEAGRTYRWVAFRAAPGTLKVGTYVGDGVTDNRSITGVGFQPEFVIVMSGGAGQVVQRSSAMPGDVTHQFDSTGFADGIQALQADGFQVGLDPRVNAAATTYYYAAWNATPGEVAIGVYTGDGATSRNITGVGFFPEWAHVTRSGASFRSTHKPASTGVGTDRSLLFESRLGEADNIQALQPDGFQVGGHARVNSNTAPNNYYWAAFGPHTPQTNYRSIGTAAAHGTAVAAGSGTTVNVTNGSTAVSGTGTTWQTANRGRGDVITIPCPDPPTCTGGVHYTVGWVGSETSLQLTQGYAGATASGLTYLIRRQFSTLAAWEDCIDGGGTSCGLFPPVPSSNLVTDDRREVGVAYKDSVFALAADVVIDGSTTDAAHTIRLTADGSNRHTGTPGAGVLVDGLNGPNGLRVEDSHVTVEWMEFVRVRGAGSTGAIAIGSIVGGETSVLVQNVLVHDFFDAGFNIMGIRLTGGTTAKSATVRNSMVWDGDFIGIEGDEVTDTLTIENCSVDGIPGTGINARSSALTIRNTIVTSSGTSDFAVAGGSMSGSNNTSSDATAPGANPQTGVAAASVFVAPNANLHLRPGPNPAVDTGLNLSASFSNDIDGTLRPAGLAWDRGADEFGATTEVDLVSFAAAGLDGAVELTWETASETNNLGFYLYRAESSDGPFALLTPTPIPGLGSSPVGARYRHADHGVVNGRTYYYLLEDYETTGRTERHGPVSATPDAAAPGSGGGGSEPPPGDPETSRITYGDPNHTSLRILESSRHQILLELTTGGFFAEPLPDGSVRLSIPDFVEENAPGSPAIPTRRAWLEAVAGRQVRVDTVRAQDVATFTSLRPLAAEAREVVASRSGAVRVGKRRQAEGRLFRRKGLYPRQEVSLLETAFQGETKKVLLELAPLRWDSRSQQLLLAQRLLVRLVFVGREPDERPRGGPRGRRYKERGSHRIRGVLARLGTGDKGLYSVRFEEILEGRARRLDASRLRLSRRGIPVAFHLEPDARGFGPGSALYFWSEGASVNPYGAEAVYELELGEEPGLRMPKASVPPHGGSRASYLHRIEREEDLFFAAQLNLPNFWPWASMLASTTKTFPFEVSQLVTEETARLELWLLGVTASPQTVEHRVRLFLNGQLLAEPTWRSSSLERLTVDLSPTLLQEGANTLAVENANSFYSAVMLDRFAVSYPRRAAAEAGVLQGLFTLSGAAEVSGFVRTPMVLDLAGSVPRWLTGVECAVGACRFRVESGGVYLAAQSALSPRVELASPGRLKNRANQYDYLVVGPRSFLEAAEPLLAHRRSQGLQGLAVSMEDVYDEFGFGESNPEALRDFLSYAFHRWSSPAPRYVLLLGDGTYDYKDHLKTGVANQVPPLLFKSTYIWTASDSLYAAVNGEDWLPDLAIGRLPASTPEEARSMVEKILAFEAAGQSLDGPAVVVADNPDYAGDFEAQAEEIATTLLASREPGRIFLGRLGADATRAAIVDAFDEGPSLLSYLGHGSQQIWAHESIFKASQVASLAPQARQPLVLTMNCLNGYFQYPYYDSLAEELVKAEGRGAIAAFSPSGLGLSDAGHVFHKAFLAELNQPGHRRLGDVVLAAQAGFADSGALPETIAIYHLFGDPALQLR